MAFNTLEIKSLIPHNPILWGLVVHEKGRRNHIEENKSIH